MGGSVRISGAGFPESMWTPRMREYEDGLVRFCDAVREEIKQFAKAFAEANGDPIPAVYEQILLNYTMLDRHQVVRGGSATSISRMIVKMTEHLSDPNHTDWMGKMLAQAPGNPRIYFLRRMFRLDTRGASVLRLMVEHLHRD
ncbi:hypothetical protein [Stenotrophomonas sp. GD03657]|uniref:hypothetical protein n=1 Tax=Stenotrophomonas sp. GD03657 TaxID=2975363 RepID=UPI0024479D5B|nr:hypothetical protein [Stenotrophomonas sp. GD03657]MDH2154121.1 hypothetical protein [Stenotrophomonas sp. GD03657]